jgi:hypothetical protein
MSKTAGGRYYTDYIDPILPSQCREVWLQFHNPARPDAEIDKDGDTLTGKWLLYREPDAVDELWPRLKESTHHGRLGVSMKATTAANPGREAGGLICVYTQDWRDIADIRRVLSELRSLGIADKLYYKADAQTLRGLSGSIYCSPRSTALEVTAKGKVWYGQSGVPVPAL